MAVADRIPALVGPTAVGKTAVVTALAGLAPVEVISADSRQVYRGLDIGTAKPSNAERAAAPYRGLDLLEPGERYSAGRFAADAAAWIVAAAVRGRLPVVVGGTGFYIRALFEGLFDEPPLDPLRRERLRVVLAGWPATEQRRWAGRLDRGFSGGGAQRAQRAVEVALLSGVALSTWQRAAAPPPPARPWYVLLSLPRRVLHDRIAARARRMLADGLVDEVRRALAGGAAPDAPGLSGVGYAEVVEHLGGRLAGSALEGAVVAATRRYAKRQETWFRHQLRGPVLTLDATEPPEALARAMLSGYRAMLATES